MAKNKADENQLDLFSVSPVEAKQTVEVAAVTPIAVNYDAPIAEKINPQVESKPHDSLTVVKEVTPNLVSAQVEVSPVNEGIKSFLKAKEEEVSEVKQFVEIAGQVKMDAISFSQSIPSENRFVSLSQHSDMVIITPIPEDGSLNLKTMKDNYPTFVTQVQRVSEDFIPDPISNLEFLDKLRTIVEGKMKASKQFDGKEIEAEMAFISKIDQGDVDFDSDEVAVEAEPAVEVKPAVKKGLKM